MTDTFYEENPGTLGGAQLFLARRLRYQRYFDYLSAVDTLKQFLSDFPSVKPEQEQMCCEEPSTRFKGNDEAAARRANTKEHCQGISCENRKPYRSVRSIDT